jgi:nitroreductase
MADSPLMKLVQGRYSLRRYDAGRPIPDSDIARILEAARLAPSAENSQPWRFIVVRDREARERLSRECFSGIFMPTRFAADAPVVLALCADRARLLERAGEAVLRTSLHELDCGIAGEHVVLAAAELGIGSCWIGWFNKKKSKKLLGVPLSFEVVALIALGYPREAPAARPKVRKSLSSIASLDVWGNPFGVTPDQDGRKK